MMRQVKNCREIGCRNVGLLWRAILKSMSFCQGVRKEHYLPFRRQQVELWFFKGPV